MNLAQAMLIRSDCPSCGPGGRIRAFVRRAESEWVRCQCGLVFLKAVIPAQEAARAPAAAAGVVGDHDGYGAYEHRKGRRIAKARHQILDVLNHTAAGPLLDIGCSLGYTLRAAAQLGLAATGVEMDGSVVERDRALGLDVHQGTMTSLPFSDAQFQVVMMKHVLEHTPDPRTALEEVRRVLKPGGGLFIAVPNLQYHRAMRHPETHRFFSFSGDGRSDGHYVYYTPAALQQLLTGLGFRIARINPHLVHRRAPPLVRLGQRAVSPARRVIQEALTRLHLRKEFWLVAVRL